MRTLQEAFDYMKNCQTPTGLRNTFHFDVPCGWLNDPNGCIYAYGKYHIFYQFNPFAPNSTGIMYWGHATTQDFFHWEKLPPAIAPDSEYDKTGCWSGGAIVKDGKMYLMYTGNVDGTNHQCMAVSEDEGLTFKKLDCNPIIPLSQIPENGFIYSFRDPHFIQTEDGLYVFIGAKDTKEDCGRVLLYKSKTMTEWEYQGTILRENLMQDPGICECPSYAKCGEYDVIVSSLNCMKTYGKYHRNFASTVGYVGKLDFANAKFDSKNRYLLDYGFDYYAPQVIRHQGRNILVGWMQMWEITYPTAKYNWVGSMSTARELKVVDGVLKIYPVKELDDICTFRENKKVKGKATINKAPLRLKLRLKKTKGEIFRVYDKESNLTLSYDDSTNELVMTRSGNIPTSLSPLQENVTERFCPLNEKEEITLDIVMDTSSVEVFVGEGEGVMTSNIYFEQGEIDFIGDMDVAIFTIADCNK